MLWADLNPTAFDFETTGTLPEYALQPWRMAQVESDGLTRFSLTSLAVYPDYANVTGLYPSRGLCHDFLIEAHMSKRYIVGWNTIFDIQCLLALGLEAEVMRCRWLDGMLLWKHAVVEPEYEMTRAQKQHFKLKGPGGVVALLWPGEENYGEGIDFHDPTPAKRAELQAYNERDTRYTYDAAKHWWERLTERQQMVALTEAESLPLVAAANLRGLPVDTLACHELQAMLHAQAAEKLAILGPLGVTEKVVRSPKQLQKVLFVDWKYPVLKVNTSKKTGNESNSTDKEVLHELALDGYENAKHIHEYRQALNRCTKFVDNPLESVDYNADGRTHPQAFVFSTYTGRMTYASTQGRNKDERQIGYAIHQEKRDKIFRAKIIAPPGYQLMEFDASGQEFRWFAVKSRDKTMLKLCMPGEKPHAFMGARIFEMDYQDVMARHAAGEERFAGPTGVYMLGKVSNLSLQYRTSAKRLRTTARTDYDIPMTEDEAKRNWMIYRQTYPGAQTYWVEQIDLAKRQGYVETLAGRRVKIIGDWRGSLGWSMESTAINFPVQGTGGDQKYLALATIKPYLRANGIQFVLDMHDGIYMFVPDEVVGEAAIAIKTMLDNLPYKQAWGVDLPIPMPWDCSVGRSWGQMKEWKS